MSQCLCKFGKLLFATLIFLYPAILSADSKRDTLSSEIAHLVVQATQKRAGVLLWMDRQQNILQVYGDHFLAEQKFRPGSTFKLITAQAALAEGIDFRYDCSGHERTAGKLQYCWKTQGHGRLDLASALAFSCNLFFSQLSLKISQNSWLKTINRYPDLDFNFVLAKKYSAADWAALAIGDSPFFKISPKQMLKFWDSYLNQVSALGQTAILQGLRRSVQEGTASRNIQQSFELLAKTGTSDAEDLSYKTNAWFLGAYPAHQPRFIFVIFLKRAHGYEEASLLAEKLLSLFAHKEPAL